MQAKCFFLFCSSSGVLNKIKSWSGCGDDVAVGLGLGEFDGLLLLEDKEAVELGGRLLLVVIPAQVQKADLLSSGLSHDALQETQAQIDGSDHQYCQCAENPPYHLFVVVIVQRE